jgi:hypothetical protein
MFKFQKTISPNFTSNISVALDMHAAMMFVEELKRSREFIHGKIYDKSESRYINAHVITATCRLLGQ